MHRYPHRSGHEEKKYHMQSLGVRVRVRVRVRVTLRVRIGARVRIGRG